MRFEVESALLVNEGGVQCTPLVFARPLKGAPPVSVSPRTFLNGRRIAALDPARAAERGQGLVAFVLEDPMDIREFRAGQIVILDQR